MNLTATVRTYEESCKFSRSYLSQHSSKMELVEFSEAVLGIIVNFIGFRKSRFGGSIQEFTYTSLDR